ncbi:MAG: peptidase M29 [delta proteobacterium ML8_F1]|nr:MAG: peptidase M29 [delta proteobacterium ML8_F1]
MEAHRLKDYARLLIETGVNLQKDQDLVITSPVENYEFVELLTQVAYTHGAREVFVNWMDVKIDRYKFLYASQETLGRIPGWKTRFYEETQKEGAAYIRLSGTDPDALKGVDPNKVMIYTKASGEALQDYREKLMNNENTWCVAAVPTTAWAKKVFPDELTETAVEGLWEAILRANRLGEMGSLENLKVHGEALRKRVEYLNGLELKSLHYTNSLGTDLTIELPEAHQWLGGEEKRRDGVVFMANLPTEEVFTLPKKEGVNGRVVASKPFVYSGTLIKGMALTFKEGKVVDYRADEGQEALKNLIELDKGSCYLGEVALVPHESPISQMNILFYNTLFDENASCHLAFGQAYPGCLKGGETMTKKALASQGMNTSMAHEDFMVGTPDLKITGIDSQGREIEIFTMGNFKVKL